MESMSRKEMCTMLCNMGHDMQDLKMCSNEELMQMCGGNSMNNDIGMMENSMSRKEMCTMLCNMGHEMEELQMCSTSQLMQMCNGMDHDMMDHETMNNDMGVMENHSITNYMFFANLKSIKRLVDEMLLQDEHKVDHMLTHGHAWAVDHIATSKDDVEEVYGFLMDRAEEPKMDHDMDHHMEKLNIIKSFKNFK